MRIDFAQGSLSIDAPASPRSVRCVRVAELVREELAQPEFCRGAQRESEPADAVVAQPDAQAAVDEGADGE
jgi:hypothetical protein